MGYQSPRGEADRRVFPRYYINLRGRLGGPGGAFSVWVVDMGGDGARIGLGMVEASAFGGDGWTLEVPDIGLFGVRPSQHRGNTFGLKLDLPRDAQERLDGLLRQRFAKRAGQSPAPEWASARPDS